MHDTREGFNKGRLCVGQEIRHWVTRPGRYGHILRKSPRASNAYLLPVEAMVGLLLAAKVALPTIEIRIDCYPFIAMKLGDLFAYCTIRPVNSWPAISGKALRYSLR